MTHTARRLHSVSASNDEEYVRLQKAIDAADEDAAADLDRYQAHTTVSLRARWEFGHRVLAERGTKAKLPVGRTAQICALAGIVQQELSFRTRFAEANPDEATFTIAIVNQPSWHEIQQTLSKVSPKRKTPAQPKSNDRPGATRYSQAIQRCSESMVDVCETLTNEQLTEALGAAQWLYELLRGEMIVRERKADTQ